MRVASRFEPSDLTFSLSDGFVGHLSTIIQTFIVKVFDAWHDFTRRCTIAFELVRHHCTWGIT